MPAIVLPARPLARAPRGPVRLDLGHALARDLALAVYPGSQYGAQIDMVRGAVAAPIDGTSTRLVGAEHGRALDVTGGQGARGGLNFGGYWPLAGATELSIELLVYTPRAATQTLVAKWGDNASHDLLFTPLSTGEIVFGSGTSNASGGWLFITDPGVFPANQWVHVLGTMRFGAGAAGLTMYVNGRAHSLSETWVTMAPAAMPAGSADLTFGARHDGMESLAGRIALAQMWRRALSADEARQRAADPWGLLRPLSARISPARLSVSSSLVSSGGTASANHYVGAPWNEAPEHAFDGNTATKWCGNADGTSPKAWLRYDFAGEASYVVDRYVITTAHDIPDRDPRAWRLRGSNDGITWTTLHTVADEPSRARLTPAEYTVPVGSRAAYRLYELAVDATAGGAMVQLAELELYGTAGGINGAGNGVSLPAGVQFAAGAAAGQRNVSAAGATLVRVASLLPGGPSGAGSTAGGLRVASVGLTTGAATGTSTASATGSVIATGTSIAAGAATGQANRAGGLLAAAASAGAGTAAGGAIATAAAAALQVAPNLTAGIASGTSAGVVAGGTLSSSTSVQPGAAAGAAQAVGGTINALVQRQAGSVAAGAWVAGQTAGAAATVVAGSASGTSAGVASGAMLLAGAQLAVGAASGVRSPTVAGATIAASTQAQAGAATGGTAGTAPSVTVVASAQISVGAPQAASSAAGAVLATAGAIAAGGASTTVAGNATGSAIAAGATLSVGSVTGSAAASGAALGASAAIAGGAPATGATAVGRVLLASAIVAPGAALAGASAVASGASGTATVRLVPGAAFALAIAPPGRGYWRTQAHECRPAEGGETRPRTMQ